MGGTKPTMDGLKAAVTANITVTIDIRANDRGKVRVDAVWKLESLNDPRHYVGIYYRFNPRVSMCTYTHKCTYTRASPTATPR